MPANITISLAFLDKTLNKIETNQPKHIKANETANIQVNIATSPSEKIIEKIIMLVANFFDRMIMIPVITVQTAEVNKMVSMLESKYVFLELPLKIENLNTILNNSIPKIGAKMNVIMSLLPPVVPEFLKMIPSIRFNNKIKPIITVYCHDLYN